MESPRQRSVSLQMKMLIGFLIGLVAGLIVNQTQPGADWVVWVTGYITQPIGNIFLRLLFMLVVPLAVFGPGHGHCGDGRYSFAETHRHQDPGLYRSCFRRSPW